MTRPILISLLLVLTSSSCLLAQTSDNTPRLKQALKRYPDADVNKDGVLTLEEAKAYAKKNPKARREFSKKKESAKKTKAQAMGGEKLVYKTVGDIELALYLFKPEGHKTTDKTPAAVFFFGGGWANGTPKQFQPQCEYLAKRGMVAISVEYRVKSRHSVYIENCIEDAKSAMRWVRGHAKKLGIDPNRIASGGGSAGGHLGACTFLVDKFNSKSDDNTVSAKPNAMILFNPVMALAPDKRFTQNENQQFQKGLFKRAQGEPSEISPLSFSKTKQPPLIMFFGTKDRFLKGAKLFQADSMEAGNQCKLVTYKDQGHGFFNRGEYLDSTIKEMDSFLVGLGWLKKTKPRLK